ncbi:MAG TPA: FAD-binding oxidoreductase [Myxococcales bacterium]
MRRWNGWGDDAEGFALPESAAPFLERAVGGSRPPRDATLSEVCAQVPSSRLPAHPRVSTEESDRVRHSRGQSLPDWIAVRSGRLGVLPDGVAHPTSSAEVRELLAWAGEVGARVIPYGGGTSVVGHVNPLASDAPVLTLDLGALDGLLSFDEKSQLATFGAGVRGPVLEARLNERGYTLGHFPQSFELATLGGWVATRSSGQQSIKYGRIEQLFAGGHLESPAGELELSPFPASAAGPDLRELILGSEGRLGVLTEATVRVVPKPEREAFHAVFFPGWEEGMEATRRIAQAGLPLAMLRLSTAEETATNLALAGHRRLLNALEKGLAVFGAGERKCMLIVGFAGRERMVEASRKEALAIAKGEDGLHLGKTFGHQWHKNRFRAPYLRNELWERGYAVDTFETALTWTKVPAYVAAVTAAIRDGLADEGEKVHVFTHLSHLYPSGSSAYTTYLFRLDADPEVNLRRWQKLKDAASKTIVERGGTISHQHGVGVDHKEYLEQEKGPLGIQAIEQACRLFDPAGILNPGKLVD